MAVVNSEPITYHDLKTAYSFAHMAPPPALKSEISNLQSQTGGGVDSTLRFFDPRSEAAADMRNFLEQLINDRIIAQEVSRRGIRVSEEEVDQQIEQVRRQNGLSESQFRLALADQGMTLDIYRDKMAEELKKSRLVDTEIRSRIDITDMMVETYYNQHQASFKEPGRVSLSRIVLKKGSPDVAVVRQKLAAGNDSFAELARSYSVDSKSASRGGRVGSFKINELQADLIEPVRAAREGATIGPIDSGEQVLFLRVDDIRHNETPPLASVREKIRQKLFQEQYFDRLNVWMNQLKSHSAVEVTWN